MLRLVTHGLNSMKHVLYNTRKADLVSIVYLRKGGYSRKLATLSLLAPSHPPTPSLDSSSTTMPPSSRPLGTID
ncbi:hypothetical protein Taro_006149 [Colocasia esculenta]|uniref:Uncharacterized protein n=1 Tax=Colocasia esculenta TaxID=4460 RepID=A0A843TUJ2_COLES|nr:hypothetical protein [Colocasia esculenta]